MWRFSALAALLLVALAVMGCERHGSGEAAPEPARPSTAPDTPAVESPAGGAEPAASGARATPKANARRKTSEEEKEEEREEESPPEKEEEREK